MKLTVLVTTNHFEIRERVESACGMPAAALERDALQVNYPGKTKQGTVKLIPWDTFFETFEKKRLAAVFRKNDTDEQVVFVKRDRLRV